MSFSSWFYGRSDGVCSKVNGSVSESINSAVKAAYGVQERQSTRGNAQIYTSVGKTGIPLTGSQISRFQRALSLPNGARVVDGEKHSNGILITFNRSHGLTEEFFRQSTGYSARIEGDTSLFISARGYGPE